MKGYYTILLLLFTTVLFAQNKRLQQKANDLYKNEQYADAMPLYEALMKEQPTLAVQTKLAYCYRVNNKLSAAEVLYADVIQHEKAKPIAWFYYAETLMGNSKYQKARQCLVKYQQLKPKDERAALLIRACDEIPNIKPYFSEVKLDTFAHNSSADDNSPVVFRGQLIFSSDRAQGVKLLKQKSGWTGRDYLSLYASYLSDDWSKTTRAQSYSTRLTALNKNTANATFTADGREVYFTRNNNTLSKRNAYHLQLFRAVCDGDEKWREIEKLSFCSAEYNYMHPAVSPDGQYLFFVSNKPRGEGGTDIYWAKRQEDGSWGKAESVGAVVNTPSHEGFPFFTNNGELFFCSKGHVGYGGFDIFMTRLQADNSWSIPVNLGQPINSSLDDISIYLNENQTRGIFTSSRNGGDDDIYLLEVKPVGNSSIVQAAPARPLIQNDTLVAALRQTSPYVSNDTLIQIATPVSSEMDTIRTSTPTVGISIDSTSTVLAKANTDIAPTQQTEAAPEISITSAKNTTGRMMSEIPTLPSSDGTGIGRVSTTSTTTAKQRVGANRPVISSIAPGPLVRLSRQLNRQDYNFKQQIVLPRINYKADAIDPDNYETLDRLVDLLREYPKVEIELGAHTLADRQEAPRRTLTEKRAYTAAAYLVEQGVATWRIVPRGYGSSRQGTDVLTLKILAF